MHRRLRLTFLLVALALVFSWSSSARAGYTHYWRWHTVPAGPALEITLVEMEKVANAKRSILADSEERTGAAARFRGTCPWGGDASEFPCILFNGVGPEAHETFGFPLAPFTNDPQFSFVKTAYKPYDVVTVACLIVARDHFPVEALEISSDGQWHGELADGARLYEQVLGRTAHDPLTPPAAQVGTLAEPPPSPRVAAFRWLLFGGIAIAFLLILLVFRDRR